MSILQNEDEIFYFAVYDTENKQLLYTKYNFNFNLYHEDYTPLIDITNKNLIFYDFLIRNNSSFDKPFTVKDDLKQYFLPITDEIIRYFYKYSYIFHTNYMFVVGPITYVPIDTIILNQFNLIMYTDEEVRKLQDFVVMESTNIYSKYNFDFDTYSNDFNVWGPKLLIFCDFVVRCIYLNNVIINAYGYGFPPDNFKKYFIQSLDLKTYLSNYSVCSVYKNVNKSLDTIDFVKYGIINQDLGIYNGDINLLKEHYLQFGQFEKRIIPFINDITPIDTATNGIVTVNCDGLSASGFLVDGSKDFGSDGIGLYLVTCYHLIQNRSNKNFLFASIVIKNNTRVLQFRVTGYEIYADICVAVYDPDTEYNKIFNSDVDIDLISKIEIDFDNVTKKGDKVLVIGNLYYDNDLSSLTGTIMDNHYVGSFESRFVLGMPDSIQLSINPTPGMSGSPLLKGDYSSGEKLKCIGMVNSSSGYKNQFTLAVSGFMLHLIVGNIIGNTTVLKPLFTNDIIRYNFLIKDAFPKRWLGISASYYHLTLSAKKNPVFINFPFNSGIIIHDFIIGFNTLTNKFIYDVLELSKQNVIRLNTPLIGSTMYNKFIGSSKTPLVIKSILMLDNTYGNYSKFDVGNYGNQIPYNLITYRMAQVGTKLNDSKYTNRTKRLYESIEIEYYYFNGLQWVLAVETIGANTDNWYIDTTDNLGNIFHQHRFDFPTILIPYIDVYHNQFIKDAPIYNKSNLTRAQQELGPTVRAQQELGPPTVRAQQELANTPVQPPPMN